MHALLSLSFTFTLVQLFFFGLPPPLLSFPSFLGSFPPFPPFLAAAAALALSVTPYFLA